MKVIEIAFVSYPVTDLKRARAFYEETLGLEVSTVFGNEDRGWVEYDIEAGTLAISNMIPEWKPSEDGAVAGLEVEDFDSAIDDLRKAGVEIKIGPFETQVCRMATIVDPDRNMIIIHKRKQ